MNKKISRIRLKPSLIPEQVSQILTEAIIDGVFQGGDRLAEEEIQQHFGISRAPIREAFRDLEKKGLVEMVPRKGTYVRVIRRKDIDEFFPILALLEGLAAKEAANNFTEEDLRDLNEALKQMEVACKRNDARRFREHHNEFHHIYINASDNALLQNMLSNLRMHIMWYRFSFKYHQEDLKHSLKVHKHIADLFNKRQTDAVETAVRVHVEIAHEKFLDYLDNIEKSNGTHFNERSQEHE